MPTDQEGLFEVSQQLYEEGWDVHVYNEEEADEGFGTSPPYDEVARAVDHRGVTDVAVIGYSQGGGAVQMLTDWLVADGYQIDVSVFVDAIDHDGSVAENDRPDSAFHLNFYQSVDTPGTIDFYGGPTTGLRATDKEIYVTTAPGWDNTDNHYLIDDDPLVQAEIKRWLRSHLSGH